MILKFILESEMKIKLFLNKDPIRHPYSTNTTVCPVFLGSIRCDVCICFQLNNVTQRL